MKLNKFFFIPLTLIMSLAALAVKKKHVEKNAGIRRAPQTSASSAIRYIYAFSGQMF